ncbi:MAG: alpha-L-fucosidase [Fimbriimonadaceae bacterium]|nr:alpha-L-fucosidase [Fimbriimonadaceae bacterium]
MLVSLLVAMLSNQNPQPVPSPRQLAWHQMETYAFVHFGPNTFTNKEWGEGKEDPKVFNPTALDCRQWVKTFKAAGLKGVIITAKHHDGFCLWPSQYSTHTVAQSDWKGGKGDVLRELSDACKAEGLKMGVYLSPWDRNHPSYGSREYNQVFARMLKEVLTQYGPIFEVWFDGANGEGPNGKKQLYDWTLFIDTVRKFQPNAVIFSDAGPDVRWVGNESGYSAETCWAIVDGKRYVVATPLYKELAEGQRNGDVWRPAECDVSIRPGWFWRESENDKVKTPAQLEELYYRSVGQNASFLLNVPPDTRGLIHENDVKALFGWRKKLAATFDEDLAKGKKIELVAKNTVRAWFFNLDMGAKKTFDRVVLSEDIAKGQRVAMFKVYADDKEIAEGTTIGAKRILKVPTTSAQKISVMIGDSRPAPLVSRISIYASPDILADELARMVEKDQKARNALNLLSNKPDIAAIEEMEKIDKTNLVRMKEIVAKYGVPSKTLVGEKGAQNAFLLIQHSDSDPAFQAKCLKLMEPMLMEGEVRKQDFALLTDRVLRAQGKPQRYGSQLTVLDGKFVMQPTEDPETLDQRRAEMNLLPMARYIEFATEMNQGKQPPAIDDETKAQKDKRMAWFREARFGMFIHWGLYAVPGGVWNGKNIPGAGEWILNSAQIKVKDYEPLLGQFNPVKFDAKMWVQIAKDAGMKYIVITSKHHEGFGLWDSKFTEWDVMGTPFKRDILAELAKACTEGGIKLCFYHSIMDWHHPDYLPRRSWDPRPDIKPDFGRYVAYMKGQLGELLTKYGNIGILWFDGEWEATWTHDQGKDLYRYIRMLQPDIIVNNRVDKGRAGMAGMSEAGFAGDYGTPEQEIPASGLPGVDWESCMTMNDTWGFHQNDHNWKSADTLIKNLVDCASKGGNYLLNVGPTPLGEIPEPSIERLAKVGEWMRVNSKVIYGTHAGPFAKPLAWGRATQTPGKLNLFVFDKSLSKLDMPGLEGKLLRAAPLGNPSKGLAVTKTEEGWVIDLGDWKPVEDVPVIVVEVEGTLKAVSIPVRPNREGQVLFEAIEATTHGGARYESDKNCIGYWTNASDFVEWDVKLPAGKYRITVEYACEPGSEGSTVVIGLDDASVDFTVAATKGWSDFVMKDVGEFGIPSARTAKLTVKAKSKPGLAVMNLRRVTLSPLK